MTQARGDEGAANWTLARLGISLFLTMNVMVFTMALWTQDFYGGTENGSGSFALVLRSLFRYLCLLFALPVLFLLGGPLLASAWESLRRGLLNTDLLLLLGVAASYLYSAISVFNQQGAVYFEVGCVVLVLVTFGRWLEARGKLQTRAALESLGRLLPDEVRLFRDGCDVRVRLDDIAAGECLRVLPGERIACDGLVLKNVAMIDEQILTGESQPVIKAPGDRVFGGSLNLDGDLFLTVTAPARGGALARLIELVHRARQTKGHFERLADRAAAWFLPLVVVVALAALASHASRHGLHSGILAGLAVLLIACPCALGLATPMALWAALGQAARAQVLFRSGETLEKLAAVRSIRFDKTGTLTTGTPTVAAFAVASTMARVRVLEFAGGLACSSAHAYALAIRQFAERERATSEIEEDLPVKPVRFAEVQTIPGRGLSGLLPESTGRFYLGSQRFTEEAGLSLSGHLRHVVSESIRKGHPVTCLGWEGQVHGVFVFREQIRLEAGRALAELRDLRLDVAVLTGDGAAQGAILEQRLNVPVFAELLPDDKAAAITATGQSLGPIAMVGDGINDAPALAASDVGIAMGCGADVTRDAASVCLLGNDLLRLPWAIALARRTTRVIRQNLFWAFIYNSVGIAFACTGRLNPVLAAVAMVLSSFLVVTNSIRLGNSAQLSTEKLAAPPDSLEARATETDFVAPQAAVLPVGYEEEGGT